MEEQIKKRAEELSRQFNDLGKQLQELIGQRGNIEQRITLVKENMLQIRGAVAELTALVGTPEVPELKKGKNKEK